jgi:hypothetical protein
MYIEILSQSTVSLGYSVFGYSVFGYSVFGMPLLRDAGLTA